MLHAHLENRAWIYGGMVYRQCAAVGARLGRGAGSDLEALAQHLYRLRPAHLLYVLAKAGVLQEGGALPAPLAQKPEEAALACEAGLDPNTHDSTALAYLLAWLGDQGEPRMGKYLANGFLARFPGHGIRSD